MEVSKDLRLRSLESENTWQKSLVAEQLHVMDGLKEFSGNNDDPDRAAGIAGLPDPLGELRDKSLLLSGLQLPGGELCAQAAGQGPGFGATVDAGQAGSVMLWLSALRRLSGLG